MAAENSECSTAAVQVSDRVAPVIPMEFTPDAGSVFACIYPDFLCGHRGPESFRQDERISLGKWHTDEDARSLRYESLLIDIPRGVDIRLWGKTALDAQPTCLATVVHPEDAASSRVWFYVANLGEWIDERQMADDLPVVDDQSLFLVVSSRQHCPKVSAPGANAHSGAEANDLLARASSSADFNDELEIQLCEDESEEDTNRESVTSPSGGKRTAHREKREAPQDAFFQHMVSGLEEDIEEDAACGDKEDTSDWWTIGIVLTIILFVLLALYVLYRLVATYNDVTYDDYYDGL
jgi:hypothetical protein